MREFLQDARYGLRALWKHRSLSITAILGLALGIGANTAIFSGLNAVALEPLPYPDAGELVAITSDHRERGSGPSSYEDFADWRAMGHSFRGMAAIQRLRVNLTGTGDPERLQAMSVSEDFFSILGKPPLHGRVFQADEHRLEAGSVVLLSEGFWRRRFGGDPAAVGRSIVLGGGAYAVVGVLPASLRFVGETDLWLPLKGAEFRDGRGLRSFSVIARLADAVSLDQAASELRLVSRRLEQQYSDSNSGLVAVPVPLQKHMAGGALNRLLVLQLAVVFLLLIACFNAASLLLASASARRGEVGVRSALGAGRVRLARQFLTEAMLLFVAGGAAGLLVARWGLGLIRAMIPGEAVLGAGSMLFQPRVLLFTLGVSLSTGLLAGLAAPVLHLRRPNLRALLDEGRAGLQTVRSQRLRKLFVAFQTALALVLLTATGLMLHSFWLLQKVDPGFKTANLLTAQLAIDSFRYPGALQRRLFYRELATRTGSLPGVETLAFTTALPLEGHSSVVRFFAKDRPPTDVHEGYRALIAFASPAYFRTLGIPVVRGRVFNDGDTAATQPVVIVNATVAALLWPGRNPVGQQLSFGDLDSDPHTVVGVVGDVRHSGLDQEPGMQVYQPIDQAPPSEATLVVRTSVPPASLSSVLRRTVWSLDPQQHLENLQTMEQLLTRYLVRGLALIRLLLAFSLATLILAAVGVFGVVSFGVAQRSHEIGLRMALGASVGSVVALVARQGLRPTLFGLLLGLPLAFGITRLLTGVLFGIRPLDPIAFIGSVVLLFLVALAAVALPSWRALRIDPVTALRAE